MFSFSKSRKFLQKSTQFVILSPFFQKFSQKINTFCTVLLNFLYFLYKNMLKIYKFTRF